MRVRWNPGGATAPSIINYFEVLSHETSLDNPPFSALNSRVTEGAKDHWLPHRLKARPSLHRTRGSRKARKTIGFHIDSNFPASVGEKVVVARKDRCETIGYHID